jgi:hypothetical protein
MITIRKLEQLRQPHFGVDGSATGEAFKHRDARASSSCIHRAALMRLSREVDFPAPVLGKGLYSSMNRPSAVSIPASSARSSPTCRRVSRRIYIGNVDSVKTLTSVRRLPLDPKLGDQLRVLGR